MYIILTYLTSSYIICSLFCLDKNKLTGPLPPRVGNLNALQFLSFCKINDTLNTCCDFCT